MQSFLSSRLTDVVGSSPSLRFLSLEISAFLVFSSSLRFEILIVLSNDPLAMNIPTGDKEILVTVFEGPLSVTILLIIFEI